MKLYSRLSKIAFLKNNYAYKFLSVAVLGIHIPLIGAVCFILFFKNTWSPYNLLLIVLFFTFFAAFLTAILLKSLINPIVLASKALSEYREKRTIPKLPQEFTDEVGLLMFNIQQTTAATENLLKDKQDLIFLLTHDMKDYALQPNALAKLVMEENPSNKIKEYAGQILSSSNNQLDFIETFISLLREEDEIAKEIVKVRRINFNEIISIIKTALEDRLSDKKLTLNVETNLSEVYLKINQTLLIRVLINLIENAIKFSNPNNQIKLKIEKKHAKLEISITDKGIGFDASKIKEMFKKFTNVGRLGTNNEKSTGIGLYLCKQIILKSEGLLTAESDGEGKGSKFSINLKIYR